MLIPKPKIIIDRIFYTQKRISLLIDNSINYIKKFVLSSINNESYYLKDMLKQPDKSEFIKVIMKEIDVYKRRNY